MTVTDSKQINIFWFRRDLRLEDNNALFHALNSGEEVLPIFIFDKNMRILKDFYYKPSNLKTIKK